MNIYDFLNKVASQWRPTGSHYICFPPVRNTDMDFVVLVDRVREETFENAGFYNESNMYGEIDNEFMSFRKGKYNLIVTHHPEFYDKFVVATEEAKRLNLTNKDDRIALFQKELYGVVEVPF